MGSRYIFGLALVMLGIMFLLDQFGVWDFGYIISTWWPLIIIIVGISHLASSNKSFITGLLIVTIGILLQASELNYLPGGFWHAFWPIIIIFIGIWILTIKYQSRRKKPLATDDVNMLALFSGVHQIVHSENFKIGSVAAYFGGAQLDLRNTKMSPEGASLDLTAAFGGIELRIPFEWRVITTGSPIFGGIENKTRQEFPEGQICPTLKINYFAAFGGIEIKN